MNKAIIESIRDSRFVTLDESELLAQVKHLSRDASPHLDPETGIEFYSVGSNASHHFSLGVKDGKLWKMSSCYDWYVDANGEEMEVDEVSIREVSSTSIYLGSH